MFLKHTSYCKEVDLYADMPWNKRVLIYK